MENTEITLLARNGKHVGSDERAGTLALDDEWRQSRDKCAGVSGTEASMWGQCNSFFYHRSTNQMISIHDCSYEM